MVVTSRSLPEAERKLIERELQPGERLVWVGKPSPVRAAFANSGGTVFGLIFAAVPAYILSPTFVPANWLADVIGRWDWTMEKVICGGFMLIGLAFIFSPLWQALITARTVHAVTNRRLLTVESGIRGRVVRSLEPRDLKGIERVEHGGELGTLKFDRGTKKDSDGDLVKVADVWYGVPNARQGETAAQALRNEIF